MSRTITWLLALLLLSAAPVAATEVWSKGDLGGSLKSFNLYADHTPAGSDEGGISSQDLRIDLTARLLETCPAEFSLDYQLLWSEPPGLANLPRPSVNRVIDLEQSWNRDGRFSSQLQVDRLNLSGETEGIKWTVGRQAIGFGRISLFSPLDVIAPFPPDALDVDVRPGVDAFKAVHYFGLAGQIGGVAVFGDRPKHNSYLLTFSENPGNVDLLLLTGSLRDRPSLGVGLAGELGYLGLKAEASWYRGRDVGRPAGDLHEQFNESALEWWYRFDNGLVLLGEYLYNGVGSADPEQYPRVAVSAPLQEGLSYLLGRHYLMFSPSYEFHPLVTGSGLLIWNLQDHSFLLRPQLAISLADNLQLDLFWAFTRGRSKATDSFGLPVVRSEFGDSGDSGGLLLRYFF